MMKSPISIVGRMEEMREDLVPMLEQVAHSPSDEMRRFIAEELPRNTSRHEEYTRYYSDALRKLVATRDEEIIARHGYRFGG